jgi:hypothetical protein
VNAPIGSFPIPPGAKVALNNSCPKQIWVALSPVTPSQASAFYTTVLPRAGYEITDTEAPEEGTAEFIFTGHGYQGMIIAFANLSAVASSADPSLGPLSLPGSLSKNVVEIMMSPPGVPASYNCPGWPG